MNDSVSIVVAVFLILIALRWMLGNWVGFVFILILIYNAGGNQSNQQGQTRTPVRRTQHRVTPQMVRIYYTCFFFFALLTPI